MCCIYTLQFFSQANFHSWNCKLLYKDLCNACACDNGTTLLKLGKKIYPLQGKLNIILSAGYLEAAAMGIPNCFRSSKIERISLYSLILNPYLSVAPPLL